MIDKTNNIFHDKWSYKHKKKTVTSCVTASSIGGE